MKPVALIIGFVWPEPTSSAAGGRSLALVRAFRDAGWRVVFASEARENSFSEALRADGVETVAIAANDPAFDAFVSKLRPRAAVFDRFLVEERFGWRVRDHSPETARVLDTVDLHFLRGARETALRTGAPLELGTDEAIREIASIYRSDLTLVLSSFEHELLLARFGVPAALLELAPFAYPEAPSPDALPAYGGRGGFGVIGTFRHAPNSDGAHWLRREIWPRVRARLPGARVHVYGAYPTREIMALHEPAAGFHVVGPVPDAFAALRRHRVNLAPLRFGAGIKGKLADGWWCGTPAVSTPIGAEGMEAMDSSLPWGGRIALDAESFAEAAVDLHEDEHAWTAARDAGRAILRGRFDARRNDAALIDAIERLYAELETRRRANFTGHILWHQSHRSTTYFSRWIELKERLVSVASSASKPPSE